MSEERTYPIEIIREQLARHQRDTRAAGAIEWLAEVIDILAKEAATVPAPEQRVESIPKYIYPH